MKTFSRVAAVYLFTVLPIPAAQSIEGDWQGTLKTGSQDLRLALHITREGGVLKATFDSIDQGSTVTLSSISMQGSILKFDFPAARYSYQGNVNPDFTRIEGTFTQGQTMPLIFERTQPPTPRLNESAWTGTLAAGPQSIDFVLRLWRQPDGKFAGSLESAAPKLAPIPLANLVRNSTNLRFALNALDASFQGNFDADGLKLSGTWTQHGQSAPLTFYFIDPDQREAMEKLEATWSGGISLGSMKTRVNVTISRDRSGNLTGTMDFLDQNAESVPLTGVSFKDSVLRFHAKSSAAFEGRMDPDHIHIPGIWMQDGKSTPLHLTWLEKRPEVQRPQTPVKPFPYDEEEVSYDNPRAPGVRLSGTLTKPHSAGPYPAVLLITGSGLQDRDETMMDHKPFLVIADYLTRKGIAVLRVDDRGFAKSTGDPSKSTTADFATDAEAGIAFLRARKDIDTHHIGLIGHSEGGVIASMLAARDPGIAFIVLLAASALPGEEIIVEQVRLMSQVSGLTPEKVAQNVDLQKKILSIIVHEPDDAEAEKKLKAILGPRAELKSLLLPWYRFFLTYDTRSDLRKVKCPVLALNGEKDLQVSPKENLAAIRTALTQGGNRDFKIVELPKLNHLFQHASTGAPQEYSVIRETIAPEVLDLISNWILDRSRK